MIPIQYRCRQKQEEDEIIEIGNGCTMERWITDDPAPVMRADCTVNLVSFSSLYVQKIGSRLVLETTRHAWWDEPREREAR